MNSIISNDGPTHGGNTAATDTRGGKKFDLEKQKASAGKGGKKCCGGSG